MKVQSITVEIYGTGTHNRGAELMACATADALRSRFPNVRIVVSPYFGTTFERAKYEFLTTWEARGKLQRLYVPALFRLIPKTLLGLLGIVKPSEIDIVLDASGFAFSDQWGPGPAIRLVRKMNSSSLKSVPLVLLPQALGTFEKESVKAAAGKLFDRSSLVYARDEASFRFVESFGSKVSVKLSPDFTLGLRSLPWSGKTLPSDYTLIVPNCRMLDRGGFGENYIGLMRKVHGLLKERGKNPYFLLHDHSEDRRVIDQVTDTPDILTHSDPRVLKGLLGGANFVLGSRFHALVSAMSQGVPCIGVGWSHKYPELFADFGVSEFCPKDLSDVEYFEKLIERLSDSRTRDSVSSTIESSSHLLKEKNQRMWSEVLDLVEANSNSIPKK